MNNNPFKNNSSSNLFKSKEQLSSTDSSQPINSNPSPFSNQLNQPKQQNNPFSNPNTMKPPTQNTEPPKTTNALFTNQNSNTDNKANLFQQKSSDPFKKPEITPTTQSTPSSKTSATQQPQQSQQQKMNLFKTGENAQKPPSNNNPFDNNKKEEKKQQPQKNEKDGVNLFNNQSKMVPGSHDAMKQKTETEESELELEWEKMLMSTEQCFREWKTNLQEFYQELSMHTRNVTTMADKRLQNNSINQNLKTIRGSIFMNRESVLKELKRMEDKQEQMENFIHKVKNQIETENNSIFVHPVTKCWRDLKQKRQEVTQYETSADEGYAWIDPSQRQIFKIFEALTFIDEEVRRLDATIDRFFKDV